MLTVVNRDGPDMTTETDIVLARLVERHGTLFSEELGLDLSRNTPSVLFRWLCAATLMSARISHEIALRAACALAEAGWTTAEHMADSSWSDRVRVLNEAGYARFDESTARMLGDTARRVQDDYGGDLRRLRTASDGDTGAQRRALKAFKGIGDVGADIFFRELQTVWSEHYPVLDPAARDAAETLDLPTDAARLARRVCRADYPRLVVALVRAKLGHIGRADLLEDAEGAPS